MRDVFIAGAARTAIGTFGGSLKDVSARTLAITAMEAAIERSGLEKNQVEQVVLGNCFDPLDHNLARIAAVKGGLPIEAPAYTVVSSCASGMQAVINGVQAIKNNDADIILAGGSESMSNAPFLLPTARWGQRLKHGSMFDLIWGIMQEYPLGGGMGLTAENLAEKYSISRQEQDELALSSHQRAGQALSAGRFTDEIVPVLVPQRKGPPKVVEIDEHPRPALTMEQLAKLKPAFKQDGTVTAGNSSGLNDAAAAVVMVSGEKAAELGLKPLARILGQAVVGVDPSFMGIGPVHAVRKVLKKTGLSLDRIELVEINEAFAAQYLACEKELGFDRAKTNVNGNGIALGHPVGATGCRLVVSLLYEMEKRGLGLGLATLCAGGGHGLALVVERV